MQFDHPNAKYSLMPGQSKMHRGKLVARTVEDDETLVCAVLCSPVGRFPPPVNKKGTVHKRQPASHGGKKENVSSNLPLEASMDKLM